MKNPERLDLLADLGPEKIRSGGFVVLFVEASFFCCVLAKNASTPPELVSIRLNAGFNCPVASARSTFPSPSLSNRSSIRFGAAVS